MKNKILLSLIFLPFLASCTIIPNYDGTKVEIKKSNNSGLVETTADKAYEYLITNSNSGLLLLSSDICSTCQTEGEKIDAYSKQLSIEVMEIKMDGMEEDEYNVLKSITTYHDAIYALPDFGESLYLPKMYLFLGLENGSAVVNTTHKNFVDFIRMYVKPVD